MKTRQTFETRPFFLSFLKDEFYKESMSEPDPEMGKWDHNPSEPREPFLPDEMFGPDDEAEKPNLSSLHMPKKPLTKEGIQAFLIELTPFIIEIQGLSRKEQHAIGSHLQKVNNEIQSGDFSEEVAVGFEKVAVHFAGLLLHSAPVDREAVLADIKNLESML